MPVKEVKFGRVFVVRLLRWGNNENHSYLWGTYTTYGKALKEAKIAMTMRAGKYDAEIYESYLDQGLMKIYRVIHWGDFDPTKYDFCESKTDK